MYARNHQKMMYEIEYPVAVFFKNYTHGTYFIVLCYNKIQGILPISIRVTSLLGKQP